MNTRKTSRNNSRDVARPRWAVPAALALGMCLAGWHGSALADARTQAKRLHDRIASVPPTAADLDAMATLIGSGNALGAAAVATGQSSFYNVTLKNFAAPWTNEAQSVFVPLNDYTATVIGMVRDNVPFNTVLSADILYVGASNTGAPAYSVANNNHYRYLEDNNVDLRTALIQQQQSVVTGLPASATAGVMTTRAAARAFFVNGTNRAMFRFTMMNYMCRDLEQVIDTSRPPDRIRRDVSRSPGGDSRVFMNNCVGCHSGMDPMAQAFAYYNWSGIDESTDDGQIQYTPGVVQPKYLINPDNFPFGYITPNDQWENRWRFGANSVLGWSGNTPQRVVTGNGAKSLGQELADSDAFAECQVEKVFRRVCFRSPSDAADHAEVSRITGVFRANNYSLKRVFEEAGVYCMGQ